MTEYAGEYLTDDEIRDCIQYAVDHKREDGWMPDRVYSDGTAVYAAGEAGSPVGEANLDNTPFLVIAAYFYLKRIDAKEARVLYGKWEADLSRGLEIVPLSENGLVYNDPGKPHSPYGFTDTIGKTGELFMESLLFWRGCAMLAELSEAFGSARLTAFDRKAEKITAQIEHLYDPSLGVFLAASEDCRQADVWGNAYLLYIGFPVREEFREGILSFLKEHSSEYLYLSLIHI